MSALGGAIDTNQEAAAAFSSAAANFGVPNAGQFNGLGHVHAFLASVYAAYPWVSITDPRFGAIGDGDDAHAAANVAAIRAAQAFCLTNRRSLYVPDGVFRINDNFTPFDGDWSGLGVYFAPGAWIKLADTLDEEANVEAGWTMILDGASNGALENFTLYHPQLDGNRTGITGFDPANTTVGIIGDTDSDFENVNVIGARVKSYLQGSGFGTYAAGIRFIDCESWDHDYHGGFCSRRLPPTTDTFGAAQKVAEWINFKAHDNGQKAQDDGRPGDGCGLDVGRYCRTVVTNANLYWNGQGLKYSIGTEYLKLRNVNLGYNLGNGLQDTDTVGTAILDFDGIRSHHNGGAGARIVSAAFLSIGTLISEDNYCRQSDVGGGNNVVRDGDGYSGGTALTYDVNIGTGTDGTLVYWNATTLISRNAPNGNGVLVDGVAMRYVIGYVEASGAYNAGFSDRSTGATRGVVRSGLMRNNNQQGNVAGTTAAAFEVFHSGTFKATGIIFDDDQGSPTQNTGMFFSSGVQADVDDCHFGTGITDGWQVAGTVAPTRVRFGRGNTGVVTYQQGAFVGSGDGVATSFNAVFATATTALGGLVVAKRNVTPHTAAAAAAHFVDITVSATTQRAQLDVDFVAAPPAAANNVGYGYEVEWEIQR